MQDQSVSSHNIDRLAQENNIAGLRFLGTHAQYDNIDVETVNEY